MAARAKAFKNTTLDQWQRSAGDVLWDVDEPLGPGGPEQDSRILKRRLQRLKIMKCGMENELSFLHGPQ